jgi:hypothetical protein
MTLNVSVPAIFQGKEEMMEFCIQPVHQCKMENQSVQTSKILIQLALSTAAIHPRLGVANFF